MKTILFIILSMTSSIKMKVNKILGSEKASNTTTSHYGTTNKDGDYTTIGRGKGGTGIVSKGGK